MKRSKINYLPILIMTAIVILAVIILSIFIGIMLKRTSEAIVDSAKLRLEASASAAARTAYYDELEIFLDKSWTEISGDEDLFKKFNAVKKKLNELYDGESGISFAYFLYRIDHVELKKIGYTDSDIAEYLDPSNTGYAMRFIMDNVPIPDDYDRTLDYMHCVPCEPVPDSILHKLGDSKYSEKDRLKPASTNLGDYSGEEWQYYLTAYAPVTNFNGEATRILAGVDIEDKHIVELNTNSVVMTGALIVAIIVVVVMSVILIFLFQKKAIQAEEASAAKSSFLSRMSHEMRTPMNAIVGLCRMAKDADEKEKALEYLDNIAAASVHLREVINDILDLSKIESGKIKEDFVEVDLNREIENIKSLILPQTAAKNQKFTVAVDERIPVKIVCDIVRLRQVVVNLLSNALKFTGENGLIALSVRLISMDLTTCKLEWKIEDDGIGMDKETQNKLFQAFEQGDNSTTRKYGGTGLGLAISKQFVEMMDGKIWVESQKGEGSAFYFTSRVYLSGAVEAEKIEYDNTHYELPDLKGKNFLLVEDAELNRVIAIDLFESYGAVVDSAENGLLGYNKYMENPDKYDIIFMDIQMPVMDGYEAARKIRASGKKNAMTIPIIAMTADVFKEDIDRAKAVGMNEHVGKPFEIKTIEQAIAKVLSD